MKTILAPIDFSAASEHALDAAVDLARSNKARLLVLHVVQPPVVMSEYGPAIANSAELMVASEKAAVTQLARVSTRVKQRGVKVATAKSIGASASVILDHAKKSRADFIVMGSHRHNAFYDLIVGSTTHLVLQKAPCPVLIVPPSGKKSKRGKK